MLLCGEGVIVVLSVVVAVYRAGVVVILTAAVFGEGVVVIVLNVVAW